MSQFKSGFMQTMSERGFVHQCTDNDALDEMLNNKGGAERRQLPAA